MPLDFDSWQERGKHRHAEEANPVLVETQAAVRLPEPKGQPPGSVPHDQTPVFAAVLRGKRKPAEHLKPMLARAVGDGFDAKPDPFTRTDQTNAIRQPGQQTLTAR